MRSGLLSLFLLFSFVALSQNNTPTALVHVTVVNVQTGKLDADQTILIDSNRISQVGPFKKIKIPANATQIDATGRFAIPGLIDAHIHFFQSGGLYTRPDGLNLGAVYPYEKDQQWIKTHLPELMARYLSAGITTVVDVGGPFSNYEIRKKVNADTLAPNAWVTGPLVSTYQPPNLDKKDPPIIKVTSEQEARELVRRQLPYHPDFIKIWYIVLPGQSAASTLPIVKATIDESHANGLKVAVHATEYETAKLAVENGADILVHSVDDRPIDEAFIQLLKTKNVAYIPTLIVAQNYNRTFSQQFNFTSYDLTIGDPTQIGSLMDLQHLDKSKVPFDYKKIKSRFPVPSKEDSTMAANLQLLQQKGGLISAGTDAGNIGTQHASSFFDELLAMKNAGLTNWEIIRSATINTAKGFGKEKDFGSIEKGKIADIVLLEKDPTADLNSLMYPKTIIHRGISIDPKKILPTSPEILVQQQLNAYNLRNMESFLEPYSDSVEIYQFPSKLILQGKDQMRKDYEALFKNVKELHCQVTERIIEGNTVIDHETVTGFGPRPLTAIAIYHIANGKIAKVYFIQ